MNFQNMITTHISLITLIYVYKSTQTSRYMKRVKDIPLGIKPKPDFDNRNSITNDVNDDYLVKISVALICNQHSCDI